MMQIGEPEGCKCPEGFKGDGVNTCEGMVLHRSPAKIVIL